MRNLKLVFALVLGLSACDTSPDLVNCDFDQRDMLTQYADNIIIPRLSELSLSLTLFESSVHEFSTNPSIGLLNEVRIFYGTAYVQYQECSAFGFGPGLINGIPFRDRFNTFPTNSGNIEANINSGTSVENAARSTVGFPALDYLLFAPIGSSTADVLASFTTDPLAAARMEYLLELSQELKATAAQVESGWLGTAGNYRETFINNVGTAEGSSIGMLVNELSYEFEIMKNFKFKIPLGKFNGGVVIPESVEAYFAGGSMQLANAQILGLMQLYEGTGNNMANGTGLFEYLECLQTKTFSGQWLAEAIRDQFDVCIQSMDLISDPLSGALINDFSTVDAAYLQMQTMVPLIKHEMTAALGVQINYQDADGD